MRDDYLPLYVKDDLEDVAVLGSPVTTGQSALMESAAVWWHRTGQLVSGRGVISLPSGTR